MKTEIDELARRIVAWETGDQLASEFAEELHTQLAAQKAEIAAELYKACQALGAKSDLLGIIGSYGDTLGDKDVLDGLRKWNAAQTKKTATS